MTPQERAISDANEWMKHSFPNCKIFENRVQSLAHMLNRFYQYGHADGVPRERPMSDDIAKLARDVIALEDISGTWRDQAMLKLARAHLSTVTPPGSGEDQWRPIETAPKDGTVIDVYCANAEFPRRYENVSWREPTDSEYWVHGSSEPDPKEQTIGITPDWFDAFGPLVGESGPTHWLPLPPSPSTKE